MSKLKRQHALHVRQYNTWVRLIRELTAQMTERARVTPLANYDWVIEGGEWKPSWELWRSNGDNGRINLMADGRLVNVRGEGPYGPAQAHQVLGLVTLQEIRSVEEEPERNIGWTALANLYSSIITMGLSRFELEVPDKLQGATLEHWGQPWSEYH